MHALQFMPRAFVVLQMAGMCLWMCAEAGNSRCHQILAALRPPGGGGGGDSSRLYQFFVDHDACGMERTNE